MQKIHEITVVNSKFLNVTDGVYSVNIFCGGNLLRTCQKVLCGGTPQGKYVYALFENDYGFIIRRKERYIAEQEQSWEDVAEVVKIETALFAEWIPHMNAYRLYDPIFPQQSVAYVDTLEEAERPGYRIIEQH